MGKFNKFVNGFYPFVICAILAAMQAIMFDAVLNPGQPDFVNAVWAYIVFFICFVSIYGTFRRV